jgi:hypothetical protein
MNMKTVIEITACIIMIFGVFGIFIERMCSKRGIGVRVIQFLTVTFILPIILILAIEQILSDQTTATLLGAVVGYILSGIGKDELPGSGH